LGRTTMYIQYMLTSCLEFPLLNFQVWIASNWILCMILSHQRSNMQYLMKIEKHAIAINDNDYKAHLHLYGHQVLFGYRNSFQLKLCIQLDMYKKIKLFLSN